MKDVNTLRMVDKMVYDVIKEHSPLTKYELRKKMSTYDAGIINKVVRNLKHYGLCLEVSGKLQV